MEKKEVKKETRKKSKKLFIIPMILVILICIFILLGLWWWNHFDKTYQIEEVTDFSYFRLYENKKYGVLDKEANVLVEPYYDMLVIPNPSKDVFIGYFNYNSQTGEYQTEVLNKNGEKILTQYAQVLPLMFQDASVEVPYEKSVLVYKENGKYGIINFEGKKITKAIYDSIESLLYKEGCLLVKQEGKYGIINIKGKEMVEVAYDSISADGYYEEETKYQKAGFIVGQKKQEGYRYGYINHNGEELLEVQYNEIDRITEITDEEIYLLALKNGQTGIYQNKKQILPHNFEEIEYNKQNKLFLVQKNGKQGVFTQEGKEILKAEYDYIMIAGENINAEKNGITYYFNKEGKEQTQQNITILSTENSNYFISVNEQDQFGIIDQNHNPVLENKYSYIEHAFGNYFIVAENETLSVMNAKTKEILISNDNIVQKVEGKNILQVIISDPYTIELYNENLEKVASMQEANLVVEENYIKLYSSKERKYFDIHGNEIQNREIFLNSSLFAFEQNGKWGFKDKENNIILSPMYDMVTELDAYGFAGIKSQDKWGVINSQGEVIVEPSYEIEWEEPEFIGPYCKLNFGYGMVYYSKEWQEE